MCVSRLPISINQPVNCFWFGMLQSDYSFDFFLYSAPRISYTNFFHIVVITNIIIIVGCHRSLVCWSLRYFVLCVGFQMKYIRKTGEIENEHHSLYLRRKRGDQGLDWHFSIHVIIRMLPNWLACAYIISH